MYLSRQEILRTVRSASFNDDVVAELLLELGRQAPTTAIAHRILDIAHLMEEDSRSLENLYTALVNGNVEIVLVHNLN